MTRFQIGTLPLVEPWKQEGNTEEENNDYVVFKLNIYETEPLFVNV